MNNVDELEDLEDLISSTPNIDGKFRFDLKFKGTGHNGTTFTIFVDTKNYSNVSGIFADLVQIKAYLKQISSFDEFRIIQQARPGVKLEGMKTAFKNAILREPKSIYDSNKQLFNKVIFNNKTINDLEDFKSFVQSKDFENSELANILKITVN